MIGAKIYKISATMPTITGSEKSIRINLSEYGANNTLPNVVLLGAYGIYNGRGKYYNLDDSACNIRDNNVLSFVLLDELKNIFGGQPCFAYIMVFN